MAGEKTTLAQLMDLIHDGDDGDEDSSATPMVSPAEEVAEADQAEVAEAPLGNAPVNPSVEEEVHMEEDLGSADDDLKVVGNLKKRKRDSGKALYVMEKILIRGVLLSPNCFLAPKITSGMPTLQVRLGGSTVVSFVLPLLLRRWSRPGEFSCYGGEASELPEKSN
nr:uncharacterized protein LOC112702371 [Arachis hypogaea]